MEKFCRKCGAELFAGDEFCGKCGKKIPAKSAYSPKYAQKATRKRKPAALVLLILVVLAAIVAAVLAGKTPEQPESMPPTTAVTEPAAVTETTAAETEETEMTVAAVETEAAVAAEPETEAVTEATEPAGVEYEHQLQDKSYYDQDGTLLISYTYDQIVLLDQSPAAQAINEDIRRDADAFLGRLKDADFEVYTQSPWFSPGEFLYTAEADVLNSSGRIFSIGIRVDWFMGGVYNSDYYGLSYDLETGKIIELTELFGMKEAELTVLLKDAAWAYLSENRKDSLFAEAQETLYGMELKDFLYYFEEEQLILLFPTYTLGPGASGSFRVPTGLYA